MCVLSAILKCSLPFLSFTGKTSNDYCWSNYSLRNEKWNIGLGCLVVCERHMKHLPWAVLVWQKMARKWLKKAAKQCQLFCQFQPISCHFLPNQDSPRQVFHMTFTSNKAAQASVSFFVPQAVIKNLQAYGFLCSWTQFMWWTREDFWPAVYSQSSHL